MHKSQYKSQLEGVYLFDLYPFEDHRGWVIESFRTDELPIHLYPAMGYVSVTHPGVWRGPHEHKSQSDLFVFVGPGQFLLHLWSNDWVIHEQYEVGNQYNEADRIAYMAIIVPPGVIHAYHNTGKEPGYVLNFPNALYAGEGRLYAVDEVRHEKSEQFAKWLKQSNSIVTTL